MDRRPRGRHGTGPAAVPRRRRDAPRGQLSARRSAPGCTILMQPGEARPAGRHVARAEGRHVLARPGVDRALRGLRHDARPARCWRPAQAALNFICSAQDPVGGGWRYEPRQPGDTSVVGWQIMALKSGYMAYLDVPAATVKKAFDFLDSVQSEQRRELRLHERRARARPPRPSACSAACISAGRRTTRRWSAACSGSASKARRRRTCTTTTTPRR